METSRAAMSVLPAEGDVRGPGTINDAVRLLRLPPTLWDAFIEQVGNPGQDLRVLAALPAHVVVHGVGQAVIAGQGLTAVEAAHVGPVWRGVRFNMYLTRGGEAQNFVDVDPWELKRDGQAALANKGSGLKEKVLKMSNLLDIADESELMPPDVQTVHNWNQRYLQPMGDVPQEEENLQTLSWPLLIRESTRWATPLTRIWVSGCHLGEEP